MPFFSVITVCKNSSRTLGRCIQSICQQTFTCFEHIVVYAESKDGTEAIVQKHQQENDFVICRRDASRGVYSALNIGVGIAKGRYLCVLHSDDCFNDEGVLTRVYDQIQSFGKTEIILGCSVIMVSSSGEEIRRFDSRHGFTHLGWMPPHPGLFIPANLFKEVGLYDDRFSISGDYELVLRLLHRHKTLVNYQASSTISHRMLAGGLSSNIIKSTMEDLVAAKRYFPLFFPMTILFKKLRKVMTFTKFSIFSKVE